MERKSMIGLLVGVALVGSVAVGWASDMTQASVSLDGLGSSASAWAARILLIGFISAICWKALDGIFAMSRIITVPITFIIIGGILLAGPILLGSFMASGAELPPLPPVPLP